MSQNLFKRCASLRKDKDGGETFSDGVEINSWQPLNHVGFKVCASLFFCITPVFIDGLPIQVLSTVNTACIPCSDKIGLVREDMHAPPPNFFVSHQISLDIPQVIQVFYPRILNSFSSGEISVHITLFMLSPPLLYVS